MSKKNLPYLAYVLLEFMPIVLITFLMSVVIIVLQWIKSCSDMGSNRAKTLGGHLSHGLAKLGKITFGPPMGLFGKKQENSDEVFINNKPVPNFILGILGAFTLMFGFLAVLVFWDVFLVRESSSCDNNIDCFVTIENGSESYDTTPISDCIDYENRDNVTISCFEFIYDIGPAFSTIGGMITGIRVLMKMISIGVIYIYSKSKSTRCSICMMITHCILVITVFFVSLITIQVLVGFLTLTIGGWIKTLLYVLTSCVALSIPWCLFTPEDEYTEMTEGDATKETQPLN